MSLFPVPSCCWRSLWGQEVGISFSVWGGGFKQGGDMTWFIFLKYKCWRWEENRFQESECGGKGPVRGYGPVIGDLEWDGSGGDDRSGSLHSGGVLEVDSRAALPFSGQEGPAVKGPDWPPPAMPHQGEESTGSTGWVFRAHANPFLTMFGAQDPWIPYPQYPKPKEAAKWYLCVVGVGDGEWTEIEHRVRGWCVWLDKVDGWMGCEEWGKERNKMSPKFLAWATSGWWYRLERYRKSGLLSGRCLLEWGFWLNVSEMPQTLVSECYFPFHICLPILNLSLVLSLPALSICWPEKFLKSTKLPPVYSTYSTSSRTGMPTSYSKSTRDWGKNSVSQCKRFLPCFFSSAFPLSLHATPIPEDKGRMG